MERTYSHQNPNQNTAYTDNNYNQGNQLYTSNSKRLMKEQMNRLNFNEGGQEMEIEDNLNQSSKINPNDMAFIEFSTIEESTNLNPSPNNICVLDGLEEDMRYGTEPRSQTEEGQEDGLFTQLNNLLDDSIAMSGNDLYIEGKQESLDFFDESIVLENVDKKELFMGLSEYLQQTENEMYMYSELRTQNNMQSVAIFKQILGVLSSNYNERDTNQQMIYLIAGRRCLSVRR